MILETKSTKRWSCLISLTHFIEQSRKFSSKNVHTILVLELLFKDQDYHAIKLKKEGKLPHFSQLYKNTAKSK
jgi:hypothetical protein